jgi:NAD(P)-dependent dehydrogenase (short-subunit alcohol dehydrogenase family)
MIAEKPIATADFNTGYCLKGRSAVITGGNRGLGQAIASAFVQAGANVLVVAQDEPSLHQTKSELRSLVRFSDQRVEAIPADVSHPSAVEAVFQCAHDVLPGLAILVNNAGVYGPIGLVEDVEWEAWITAMQVNLLGTVLMCRAVLPSLRRAGYGKIINLSGGGATGPLPRFSAYAASKAAVVRFTETLAEEVRTAGIDVNAIAPGALNTRLLDQVLDAGPEKAGRAFYERALQQREQGGVPLAKGANLAVFLASAASDGITGRLLSAVWDDWAALANRREELSQSDVYTLRRIVPEDRDLSW